MNNRPIPITRVMRTKEEARFGYNRLSRWYDLVAGGSEKKFRDVGLQMLNAQPGEIILEIGPGTGHNLLTLAQSVGEKGTIHGLDISDGMMRIASKSAQAAGLSGRIGLCCGDAAGLPYANESFDALFMSFVLELFDTPEIPLVLQECRRVLRRPGRISIVALSKEPGAMVGLYEWAHEHFPVAVDCRPIYPVAALSDAGFQPGIRRTMKMWGLPVEIVLAERT